jgi:hypothetical protein
MTSVVGRNPRVAYPHGRGTPGTWKSGVGERGANLRLVMYARMRVAAHNRTAHR